MAAPVPALAWDYPGHRIVGAIADLALQQHYPDVYQKVQALLATKGTDGKEMQRTLSQVAVFPDCAKRGNEPYCRRPPSDEEKAYAARNPRHATYHYTDVPIEQRKYIAGSAGTAETDVVQMIGYAVAQLRHKTPAKKKDVDLTDTEAVWLIAHLVGDIHQPLHVGAKYYDKNCTKGVDPNREGEPPTYGIGKTIAETVGGNLISLTGPGPAVPHVAQIHALGARPVNGNKSGVHCGVAARGGVGEGQVNVRLGRPHDHLVNRNRARVIRVVLAELRRVFRQPVC